MSPTTLFSSKLSKAFSVAARSNFSIQSATSLQVLSAIWSSAYRHPQASLSATRPTKPWPPHRPSASASLPGRRHPTRHPPVSFVSSGLCPLRLHLHVFSLVDGVVLLNLFVDPQCVGCGVFRRIRCLGPAGIHSACCPVHRGCSHAKMKIRHFEGASQASATGGCGSSNVQGLPRRTTPCASHGNPFTCSSGVCMARSAGVYQIRHDFLQFACKCQASPVRHHIEIEPFFGKLFK